MRVYKEAARLSGTSRATCTPTGMPTCSAERPGDAHPHLHVVGSSYSLLVSWWAQSICCGLFCISLITSNSVHFFLCLLAVINLL